VTVALVLRGSTGPDSRRRVGSIGGLRWKHAKPQDLVEAKVYDAMVKQVASQLRPRMDDLANGLAVHRRTLAFFA
jgi:hypothetical protein